MLLSCKTFGGSLAARRAILSNTRYLTPHFNNLRNSSTTTDHHSEVKPKSTKPMGNFNKTVPPLPSFMPGQSSPFTEEIRDINGKLVSEPYEIPENYFPQKRDPYEVYDDRQNRRNLNEPLHPYHDFLDVWSPDYYDKVSNKSAVTQFLTFFGILAGFGFSVYYFELNPEKPAMPRNYPYNGLAKDLGSRSDSEDDMYRARADTI